MSEVTNAIVVETTVEPPMRTLMVGSCPSLSGASKIRFVVLCPAGSKDVSAISFRISGNSGQGKWNATPVSIAAIERALSKIPPEGTFSAAAFGPIYAGGSSNSPGFLAAILLSVGLIARAPEGMSYVRNTAEAFWEEVKSLVASGLDLQPVAMGSGDAPMASGESGSGDRKVKKSKPTVTTIPATTAES